MARQPTRRFLNRAVRRKKLRECSKNTRWMHLGAGAVGTRQLIQRCWARHTQSLSSSVVSIGYAIVLRGIVNQQQFSNALQPYINYLVAQSQQYANHVNYWRSLDGHLYDIPLIEYLYAREFRPRMHLRIGALRDDMTARKMTRFNIAQLWRLYDSFGLRQYCALYGETNVRIGTGHQRHGSDCCYLYDPEELFLFALTKIATGLTDESIIDNWFGGDYARWGLGYRWFIFYLDERYKDIVGHQGLQRYVSEFWDYRQAINEYLKKDRWYEDHAGNRIWVPGLHETPFNVGMFIDDSVDPIMVPFSGPAGDYQGAPRRQQYFDAQESVYSGYKKIHSIKVETLYLPNGLSTIFGPVSGRHGDRGVLNLSGLDRFLGQIQDQVPAHQRVMVFGDSIFRGVLDNITSYYRAIPPDVLNQHEIKINAAFRAARMPIERNYGQTSCVFRICDSRRAHQLGKRHPYALEQLRVCHLLMNCYICCNGDQGGGVNTFACTPPRLEEYLEL